MSTFLLTLAIASVFVLLAVGALAIGWLLTGKSKIVRGACGMDPHRLRNERCGTPQIHCDLCEPKDKPKKESTHDDDDAEEVE